MQIPNVKYLQTETGQYACFYQENHTIFCRISTKSGWSAPTSVATHVLPLFSLCQYDRHTYLLYTTEAGELILCASGDLSHWEPRTLYQNAGTGSVKYFMIPQKDTFHVVYHVPTEQGGIHSLMYSSFRQGQWQTPYCIDRFLPLPQEIFRARRLGNEHIILYYRSGRNTISAREMLLSPFTVGSAVPFIQTGLPCIDFSVLHDAEKMHILYAVKNMFRTQVLYRFKQSTSISNPRLLWEGNSCTGCLLHTDARHLILYWTTQGQTFRCVSENNGYFFGPIEQCIAPLPPCHIKGELVSARDFFGNAAELFGNRERDFLPVLLPASPDTVLQSAYAPSAPKEQKRETAFPSKNPPAPDKENIDFMAFSHPFSRHENTAAQTAEAIHVQELTALLTQRSNEISQLNDKWQQRVQALESSLSQLKEENQILQSRLSSVSFSSVQEVSEEIAPTSLETQDGEASF